MFLKTIHCTSSTLIGFVESIFGPTDPKPSPIFSSISELYMDNSDSTSSLCIGQLAGLLHCLTNLRVCKLKFSESSSGLFGGVPNHGGDLPSILRSLPQSLEELDMRGFVNFDDHELMNLGHLACLKSLSLGTYRGRLHYKDFEWITNLTSLTSLSLCGDRVYDLCFARLRNLPSLCSLYLNISVLPVKAFMQLSWVHSLQKIHLSEDAAESLASESQSENDLRFIGSKLQSRGVCLSSPVKNWRSSALNLLPAISVGDT